MKVLHVPHAYYPAVGGAELICKKVSEQMVEWGHEVRVVTADVAAVQAYYEYGVDSFKSGTEEINGVRVDRLKYADWLYRLAGRLHESGLPDVFSQYLPGKILSIIRHRFRRALGKSIRQYNPDVVMTMPHLVINVVEVIRVLEGTGIPLVMVPMLHEDDPDWEKSEVARALQNARAVVSMTEHEATRLASDYAVSPARIFPGGVGIDLPDEEKVGSNRQSLRVVYLGRQTHSKGVDKLVDAMRLVMEEVDGSELYIAGTRVPESGYIDEKVKALPPDMHERVVNLESLTDDEKNTFLASASCLVLPSRIESFGMVILDAWAHRVPVVVWDTPLFRTIVKDRHDGLLVSTEGNDTGNLAEAIAQILRDPKSGNRMGENGYNKVRNVYNWNNVANGYLQAYQYAVGQD